MRINRKTRITDGWLLPGCILDMQFESGRQMSPYIGDIFEGLTEALLGGERVSTSSADDICPDILFKGEKIALESKASNRHSGHKLSEGQLKRYEKMRDSEGWEVKYCFWLYEVEDLFRTFGTLRELIEGVTSCIGPMTILDLNVVRMLVDEGPLGTRYHESWSPRWDRIRGYPDPLTIIRPSMLRRLHDDPEKFLREELSDPQGLEIETKKSEPLQFEVNGIEWESSTFDVLVIRNAPAPF